MKTVQVFLSHTSDMAQFPEGRTFVQAALDAVGRARMAPVDMRYFAARDGMPVDYCRQQVRASDIYVAIIGFRYGSVVAGESISHAESEFLAASGEGLPRLVFLLAGKAYSPERADADMGPVEGFRKRLLSSGLLVREFTSSDSLELEVFHALSDLEGRLASSSFDRPKRPVLMWSAGQAPMADGLTALTGTNRPGARLVTAVPPDRRRHWRRTGLNPAQVPAEPPGFAGRATELQQLLALLPGNAGEAGEKPPGCPVALITGTAGVGKTTLAIRFTRLAASRFPDGQLYVNLRGFSPGSAAMLPGTALQGFLDALGVSASHVPSALEAQSALLRTLLDGKRMLLLLDNALDAGQVRPLLPASPGCMAVVTSRSQLAGLVVAQGAQPLSLGVLNADEAAELMARRLGARRVSAEPDAVSTLVRQSAGLPLALSVTCALAVMRPAMKLADLAAELADARGRLDALRTGDTTTDLRAVFSWSADKLSGPAARMFRLLGLHPGPDISAVAAASLAAVTPEQARTALAELTRASLLTEDSVGRFGCHDLLRAYCVEQAASTMNAAERELTRRRIADHYLRSAHAAAALLYPARAPLPLPPAVDGVGGAEFAAYDAALAWFVAEHKVLLNVLEHAETQRLDEHCWKLSWCWAPLLKRRGRLHELHGVQRIGLRAASRLGDADALAHVHYELGHVSGRLGDYDTADRHLRQALELFTELDDEAGIGQARHGLGLLLDHQGRFDEAIEHAVEGLRVRRLLGDPAAIAYSENSVGWIQAHRGHPDEGLLHCRRALVLHHQSGSRTGVADTLDSLAYAYGRLADHAQSIAHYEQAIEMYQLLGDPQGEAASRLHLGDVQLTSGQPDAARRSWEQALTLLTRVPGSDTSDTVTRMTALPTG
jgi:tetratricopeptide (TPR) repeat protein